MKCSVFLLFGLYIFGSVSVFAQNGSDSTGTVPVEILSADIFRHTPSDSGTVNKLLGNVVLRQKESIMYCDSAYLYSQKNALEAFGHVRIEQQDGTEIQSDYLRYDGRARTAYLVGNVVLSDGKNKLWTESLDYDLSTKTGNYQQGGTLRSGETVLSSIRGIYEVATKDAYFSERVIVNDPEYNILSEKLRYNTDTRVAVFSDSSIIANDESILRTTQGFWDALQRVGRFTARSSIFNNGQYIESDTLFYDRNTGLGTAQGNVFALDTSRNTSIYCGHTRYSEITHELWATKNPVLKKVYRQDSLYIRADTFYAAPEWNPDSLAFSGDSLLMKEQADSFRRNPDSVDARYFVGFHEVMIYSDSLQAVCDSISYSQRDSLLRLMYDPVLWSGESQITGDTILLWVDSNALRKMYVPDNAFIVSRTGPPQGGMFDQIQGKTLTGFFQNNKIDRMIVWPNAEAIYYARDDDGAYLGQNIASSERMTLLFEEDEIRKILLEQEVEQIMTPLEQVNFDEAKLDRFLWVPERRPQGVAELFYYKSKRFSEQTH